MIKKKISIIIPTLNCVTTLNETLVSIFNQNNKNFELIIIDGDSNDGTIKIIKKYSHLVDHWISEKDEGIYDAINKGIKITSFDYYLIVGSDDVLFDNAVDIYINNINENIDIITANIIFKEKIQSLKKGPIWLHGPQNLIVGHTIACLINKKLHDIYGYYTLDLIVAADTYFLLKIIRGSCKIRYCKDIVGKIGAEGISNKRYFKMTYEHMLAQIRTGSNVFIQLNLMIIKQIYFFVRYFVVRNFFNKN